MGFLDDSDSEYDCSVSSIGFEEPVVVEEKRDSAYSAANVLEGELDERLSAVLSLKNEMGVEQDPDYVEKEARKQATKEKIVKEKKKEQKAMKNMNKEEQLEHQKHSVKGMMDRIRMKRAKSMDMVKRDPIKRNSSNQSLGAASCHSASSSGYTVGMEEDEVSEFQRLRARKERRKRRSGSKSLSPKPAARRVTMGH